MIQRKTSSTAQWELLKNCVLAGETHCSHWPPTILREGTSFAVKLGEDGSQCQLKLIIAPGIVSELGRGRKQLDSSDY